MVRGNILNLKILRIDGGFKISQKIQPRKKDLILILHLLIRRQEKSILQVSPEHGQLLKTPSLNTIIKVKLFSRTIINFSTLKNPRFVYLNMRIKEKL